MHIVMSATFEYFASFVVLLLITVKKNDDFMICLSSDTYENTPIESLFKVSLIRCALRILDSFGTHAEFNYNSYFISHRNEFGTKRTNPWGGHELNLQQFMTMYPHTDDNTFLGFVVEMHDVSTGVQRENITLVKHSICIANCFII